MYVLLTLLAAVGCAHASFDNQAFCEPIHIEECRSVLKYNQTARVKSAHVMSMDYQVLTPLLQTNCAKNFKLFVCSALAPMCASKHRQVIRPCKPECDRVRRECEHKLKEIDIPWPDALNCEGLHERNEKGTACIEYSNIEDETTTRLPVFTSRGPDPCEHYRYSDRYVFINRTRRCALRCEQNAMFSREERNFMASWQAAWSIIGFLCSLLTVISFAIDARRYTYPQRSLLFIALSSGLYCVGYIVRFGAGRATISCDKEADGLILIQEGLEHPSCSLVFVLLYNFGFSAVLWWVILCLNCFLHNGLGWSSQRIKRYDNSWHVIAWMLPAVQTVAILVMRAVDGDELGGTCFVGNQSDVALLGFVVCPLAVYLTVGSLLLVAQLVRQRSSDASISGSTVSRGQSVARSVRTPEPASDHRRSLLVSILLMVVFSCVLITYVYEYCSRTSWLYVGSAQPRVWLFYIRVFFSLTIGAVCGLGIATSSTLHSWQTCCSRVCRVKERTKYHAPSTNGSTAPYRQASFPPSAHYNNTSLSSFTANPSYYIRSNTSSVSQAKASEALV